MHQHIYSFCSQPGCKDKDYYPNTEDLVSPALSGEDISAYFADKADESLPDDHAIVTCHEQPCVNPIGLWLYIKRGDPLMAAIRPNHWRPDVALEQGPESWAKAHSRR